MSSEIQTALKMYRGKLERAREHVTSLEAAIAHLEAAERLVQEAGSEISAEAAPPTAADAPMMVPTRSGPTKSARREFAARQVLDIVNSPPLRPWNLRELTEEVIRRGMSPGASFASARETVRAAADGLVRRGAIGKPPGDAAVYQKAGHPAPDTTRGMVFYGGGQPIPRPLPAGWAARQPQAPEGRRDLTAG